MSPVREDTAMVNRTKAFGRSHRRACFSPSLKRHWQHPTDGAFVHPPVELLCRLDLADEASRQFAPLGTGISRPMLRNYLRT